MSIILSTENLEKRYKGVAVLKDININVSEGEIYGLLGPNGAGKSTLLKIIAGIVRVSEGRVLLKGEPWSRKNSRDIGYLIEEPVIYENLTAYENLKVIAIQCALPERKIPEVLTRVGLKDTGRKSVKKFSMGMKQRLGIALALLKEPRILILDEPTNGLDPYGIKDIRELIKSFSQDGITVIVASHILQEVALMAGRVGIIHEGKLCYEGNISGDTNLEDLFMEVTRRERRDSNA